MIENWKRVFKKILCDEQKQYNKRKRKRLKTEDFTIKFVHYESFEEGVRKWEERKKRINGNNLFIVGTEKECSYEAIKRFDRLPYENKVIITHVEYPEFELALYMKGLKRKVSWGY